jgi:two-component system CheB/CheR fusion protein
VLGEQSGPAEVAVEAVNRRGRAITVRVAASPLAGHGSGDNDGAIIVMETGALLDVAADPV